MIVRLKHTVALPLHRGSVLYCWVTALAVLAAGVATLCLGRLGIPLADLPSALLGGAEGKTAFVLERLRGPRLATAVLTGALLGLSGALFQGVTRNPLGSPDVIGLGAGAGAGVAVTSLHATGVPTPVGAVLGAAVAALLVHLCTGTGFRSPTRTIVAGIGVSAAAYALTQYVVSVRLRDAAAQLAAYLAGSLNAASARDVAVAGVALAVTLPLAMTLPVSMRLLEMGDETAAGLGVDPDRVRTAAIVLSVVAAGAAVAAAGPIAFVALTAPQIARRTIGSAQAGVLPAAFTGALIMVLADLAAQQVPAFDGLPVGVLTLGVGGCYLGHLLLDQHRKGRL
ncbi:iron chelate uptake ABC transporter family permease subunit [Kineosporia sp. J2-2]|uniref:Iron chelate uptake ABC transporter family permease subunit n=1 Tax=Kineosporia corallincola TaxID=2835133 RepID=A0ABS5TR20_9ACTN|nr:iron chelate uptake ABC transporter family permease subunit [Kineosporia corallincola]MBT0772524.1 iron chelate uptake ABC transporter family permease subunit [Kineosporia corallincola]